MMTPIPSLAVALCSISLLSGCERQGTPPPGPRLAPAIYSPTNAPDLAMLARFQESRPLYFPEAFAVALAQFPDSNLVWRAVQAEVEKRAIEDLSRESRGQLAARLDVVKRGRSTIGYTAEHIEAALRLKSAREREKAKRDALKRVIVN